jgi:hypothetical protein
MFATVNNIFTALKSQQELRLGKRNHLTFTAREILLDNPYNKLMLKNLMA